MKKKDIKKKNRYYFICSILTSIVFLAIGAYTIYAAIPSPGHGTSALEGNASLNMNSNKIINLSTPTADTDAATKAYVDAAGSKTAFRFIVNDYNTCPTIEGVTCRAMDLNHNAIPYIYPCTGACWGNYGCICYYSSL